ncbi:MarR family winged helix-turn-helix transcriptional regulator [Streptomyces sulfonofaciens]|uniref:MarR family winged helix-turn-helix transcriptional regulator n=1 Tax=Streptomyces sulfonofaciens TaxID=68272 RepID=UPI001676569A|nr:MarR family transcriptional regulator [Streptomyces sulfonofaciens]
MPGAPTADASPAPGAPPTAELYRSLADLAYAMAGPRAHTRLRTEAEVPVDRASLALLRTVTAASSPLRIGELAEALMVRPSHVSREVRRLQKRGLVAFLTDARDQRVRQITVTEDGRDLVDRAQATGRRWLSDALDSFTPQELNTTAAVIRRVIEAYRNE